MFRAYSLFFIFSAGLVFAFYAQKQSHAQTIEPMAITTPVIIEVVTTSAGPINCFRIKEGFLRGKWVTEHRICQYEHDKSMVWVEAHWTCYEYDPGGVCTSWIKWSSGWNKAIYIAKASTAPHHIRKSKTTSHGLYSSCCLRDTPIDRCE